MTFMAGTSKLYLAHTANQHQLFHFSTQTEDPEKEEKESREETRVINFFFRIK